MRQSVEPVVSEVDIVTSCLQVKRGQAAGVHNTGSVRSGGREVLTLDLRMYVGCPDPRDRIRIEGDPSMELLIPGGTPGDIATAAILINMVPVVAAAEPGLRLMSDVPIPRCGR
jgi:4-hydroxy-tetrahydrodipicolinate reductase